MTTQYASVREYFEHEKPSLVHKLDGGDRFWKELAENKVSNEALAKAILFKLLMGKLESDTFIIYTAVFAGRFAGKIPNPEAQTEKKSPQYPSILDFLEKEYPEHAVIVQKAGGEWIRLLSGNNTNDQLKKIVSTDDNPILTEIAEEILEGRRLGKIADPG